METLKILMISSHYPPSHLGGDAVMVQYLSEELVLQGHEVHVIHNPAVYELVRKRRLSNCADTSSYPSPFVHKATESDRLNVLAALTIDGSAGSRAEVLDLARRLKPDVMHWHNTKGFIGRPFIFHDALSLYTAHDYYAVCPRSNLLRPDMSFCETPKLCQACLMRWKKPPQIWRIGSRRVIRLPEQMGVICPSDFMSRRLKRDGISTHHILRNFVPDPAPPISAEPCTGDSIAFVGMLEPHKGPRTLLEAFVGSRDRQGFKLHIIGEGSMRGELNRRVKDFGLANRVSVPGFLPRSEVESIRRSSAAIVVPSEWPENAPLTALESLALGVPVLASDAGGLPEIVGPESGSMIFKAGDVKSLSDCIASLWQNRSNLGEMKRKAREAYVSRFSPAVHIAQYLRIIRDSH
jgi:glycosyltransferase involved in cell wall biosynthesis